MIRNESCHSVTCLRLQHFLSSNPGRAFSSGCRASARGLHWRATDFAVEAFLHHHWFLAVTKVTSASHLLSSHCVGAGVGGKAMSFNLLTSICQFGSFLADRWRRACLVKWSLLMNRRSHMGQANFFSPVWVLRCLDSSSERANLLSQPFQLQLKGFSPVCVLMWAFR